MKTNRQKLGTVGEDMAVEYLQKKGYKIIERNFRHNQYELDIICQDKKELVIVEVKSVRVPEFGSGEARISKGKQGAIFKASYAYLDRRPRFAGMDVRFDVVCVKLDCYPARIDHHKAAFWQSW
jgi:putative endonuclease